MASNLLMRGAMFARCACVTFPLVLASTGLGLACNALLGTPNAVLASSGDASEDGPPTPSNDGGNRDSTTEAGSNLPVDAADDAATAPESGPPLCCGSNSCDPLNGSPDNCGTCGHNCLGGGCISSTCSPTFLVGSPAVFDGLQSLYGLTVMGDTLYGTDWYTPDTVVYTSPTTGHSDVPSRVYPAAKDAGNAAAISIVNDDAGLYFAVYRNDNGWTGGIYSVAPSGDGGLLYSSSDSPIGNVAVDSNYVYWSEPQGYIWRGNKDGTGATQYDVGPISVPIVARGGRLYYVTTTSGGLVAVDPSNLNTILSAFSGGTTVSAFTVGNTYVFWIDQTAQRIYRSSLLDTGAPQDITPPGLSFTRKYLGMLTDDEYLYVENSDISNRGATIWRVATDGSSYQPMTIVEDAIMSFVQDATALYFTTYGTADAGPYSAVWKLAK